MPTYYHVDRTNNLSERDIIRYQPVSLPQIPVAGTNQEEIKEKARDLLEEKFPESVTQHGDRYCMSNVPEGSGSTFGFEFYLEMVRQADFSDKHSRFQSVFAWENLEDARWFAREYSDDNLDRATILEIEGEKVHKGDFNLATVPSFNYMMTLSFCHLYWEGEEGTQNPHWEILLEPPVEVVEEVEIVDLNSQDS